MYLKGRYINITVKLRKWGTKDNQEYIWHCPRPSCQQIIITKTKTPYLNPNEDYICNRCLNHYTSEQLTLANKKNIKKFLDNIDNSSRI